MFTPFFNKKTPNMYLFKQHFFVFFLGSFFLLTDCAISINNQTIEQRINSNSR